MKRLLNILALALLVIPAKAQETPHYIQEHRIYRPGMKVMDDIPPVQKKPEKLTFSHTVYYPGMGWSEILHKADMWIKKIIEYENCSLTFTDNLYSTWVADINLEDCPNFGVSEFLGGGPTRISIEVNVVAKDNAYTIFASNIFLFFNPMWGTLYGENGQLYPELYTKKQLKHSIPIIEYVSDRVDEIFREFDEYMQSCRQDE